MLGQAFAKALGDKRGIRRFGHALVPMDEAMAEAAIDISGRPFLAWDAVFERHKIGEMDTELFEEFFRAFAMNALLTLHVTAPRRHATHTTLPKPASRRPRARLRMATEPDPRGGRRYPLDQGGAVTVYTAHIRAGGRRCWCARALLGVR